MTSTPAPDPSPITHHPSPSFEHGHAEYTDAELLEQARGNAQALILGTISFLKARGVSPEDWAAALGETFSRGWGDPRPWDAGEFLDAMLTNLRAFGANFGHELMAVFLLGGDVQRAIGQLASGVELAPSDLGSRRFEQVLRARLFGEVFDGAIVFACFEGGLGSQPGQLGLE